MARQRIIGEWLEIPPVASTDEMIDHLNRTIRTLVEAIERIGAFVMYRSTASEKDPTVNPQGIWDLRDNTLIPHSATSGNVEPKEDGENDFGSSDYKWQKGWFNNIHVEDQLTDGNNDTTVQEVRTHIDTTSGNPHGVDFIELDDAPSDYTGRGGEIVLVKATEDGLDTQPWPATGVNLNYFLSDNSADIGGYYYMYSTETGDTSTQLTSSALGIGDDQLLWTFVTETGEPGVDTLALGAYTATLYLQKSGNKDARVYWKLFKRDTGGTETELLQSAVSDQLTDTSSQYVISAYLNEDQVLDPTDRLVLKLYANVSGTGNDVSITLTMEGDYDSRILIHILSSSFSLDRLSDVDVSSPADDELLAYDSGSGKWTNKALSDVGTAEHGNEAHSPDFLAVDGSNKPTADIDWNKQRIRSAFGFPIGDPHWDWGIERIENNFLFHADKRWTVTVSTSPYSGSVSDLFTASPDEYVKWYNSDLPVTIEVDFGGAVHYFVAFGFSAWNSNQIPKDFKIEIYKTDTSTWETVADVTGNTQWCYLKYYKTNYVGKIKWTISAVNSGDLILSELIALRPSSKVEDKWPFLPLDATRDIDAYMSGNKWLSVATSGIVGLPKQSACGGYLYNGGTNFSVPATTWTKIPFDLEEFDIQGEFDPTTNRITVTEDGTYIWFFYPRWIPAVDQQLLALRTYKNGVGITPITQIFTSGTDSITQYHINTATLTAGDYLEFYCYTSNACSITSGGASGFRFFKIH